MNKSYVIHWKSAVNGRTGKGTKMFDLDAAERLAEALNREYPNIHHEVVEASPAVEVVESGASMAEGESSSELEISSETWVADSRKHHFSFS